MGCCVCKTLEWSDEQQSVYFDDTGEEYCVFHAPAEHKSISLGEFNDIIFDRIRTSIHDISNNESDIYCDLSGTIFPGQIVLREFGENNPLPNINFSKAQIPDADFRGCRFSGIALFVEAIFEGKTLFSGATFDRNADFTSSIFAGNTSFVFVHFNDCANFVRAGFIDTINFSSAKFESNTSFYEANFNAFALFDGAKFYSSAVFNISTFRDKLCFDNVEFKTGAHFVDTRFFNTVTLYNITAPESSLLFKNYPSNNIKMLRFSASDIDSFNFENCDFSTWFFDNTTRAADIEAYRRLFCKKKKIAAGEQDQIMRSQWHYNEKLMFMKQQWYRRFVPLTPTWLYWASSGFGEKPVRAWWILVFVCTLPALIFGYSRILETGFSPQANWNECALIFDEYVRCIPFIKIDMGGAKDCLSIDVWKIRVAVLFQILIALQAMLFAFALRNRFRR